MNRKVYVANLPYQTTEPELKALFSKAGDVMSVKIVQDRQNGQPRGVVLGEDSHKCFKNDHQEGNEGLWIKQDLLGLCLV